jgi:hypothetical protein
MALSVYTHQISNPESSAKAFDLDGTPVSGYNVALDLIGGTAQSLNGDFGVDGTKIVWDSTAYGLNGQLSTNDIVRVIYDRS